MWVSASSHIQSYKHKQKINKQVVYIMEKNKEYWVFEMFIFYELPSKRTNGLFLKKGPYTHALSYSSTFKKYETVEL